MSTSEQTKLARALLRSAALRATAVRVTILASLLKSGCPLSHNDLWRSKRIRAFNRVTVYRTLLTLQKHGIAHAVQGTDGLWRYCAHDLSRGGCPGNHPHFVCTRCRRMICLLDQTMPFVRVPKGTMVKAKQFVVYGTCAACRAGCGAASGAEP